MPAAVHLGHSKQTHGTPQPASGPQLSGVEEESLVLGMENHRVFASETGARRLSHPKGHFR